MTELLDVIVIRLLLFGRPFKHVCRNFAECGLLEVNSGGWRRYATARRCWVAVALLVLPTTLARTRIVATGFLHTHAN